MRIRVLLETQKAISVSWDYRTELTRAIYRLLTVADPAYSDWLRSEGFRWNRRCYRLFVYSDLFPTEWMLEKNGLVDVRTIVWEVSSADERFMGTILKGIELRGWGLELFGSEIVVRDILRFQTPKLRSGLAFRTSSPVAVSVVNPRQFRHPIYLSPDQPEFVEALENNLIHKWQAFHKREWDGKRFQIRVWNPKRKLIPVFDINVIAWHLNLQMWGDEELIRFAYEAGLGVKNSQGFGMIEPL